MINVTVLEKVVSASGKYLCFFGNHYEKGHSCWVVGTHNISNHETVMRHYNTSIEGCVAPEAQAKTFWQEFHHKMTTIPEGREYEPTYVEELQRYLN